MANVKEKVGSRRIRKYAGLGRGCGQGTRTVAGEEVCQVHKEEAMRSELNRKVRKFAGWQSQHFMYREAHMLYTHSQHDWASQIQSTGLESGAHIYLDSQCSNGQKGDK
eukprot:14131192-Heterocapsa_arctica.AAC.1